MGGFGKGLIGSGITQTKEEQMRNLADAGARAIERYLLAHDEWFRPAGAVPAEAAPAAPPAN
jgi:hypothetical protein